MPIPACCIKAKNKSALLYSKGGLYAGDDGIELPQLILWLVRLVAGG